jgi:predicted RNA-binding Zn-ribbon protein involved in translation (DUF1610 family)
MMKILRHRPAASPDADVDAPTSHPESCPWCGQQRVRGIIASTDDPQYRCAACGTTFFIHTPTARPLVQRRSRA